MKPRKEKRKQAIDLARANALAKQTLDSYRELLEIVDDDSLLASELNHYINPHSSIHDVLDQLNLIDSVLVEKTDGRPKPFSLKKSHGYSTDLMGKVSPEQLEEMDEQNARLLRWGECSAPGYQEIVSIGSMDLTMNDLTSLRSWIDSVIAWHKANPTRKGDK